MPLLTDLLRTDLSWGQLIVESVLVVLSVLLALSLTAWYDHTQEQEKVRLALRSLHAELTQTNATLERLIPIHQAHIDTLRSDTLDFEVGVSFRLRGVSTEAWTTAQQTGAVALMDYDVVAPISRVYAQTKDLEFMRRKSYDLTFDGNEYLGFEPERLGDFWGYLNDYVTIERKLRQRSVQAIVAIEERMPSLATRPDSDTPPSDLPATPSDSRTGQPDAEATASE